MRCGVQAGNRFGYTLSIPLTHPGRTNRKAQVTDLDLSKISTCSFEAMQLHVGERLQLDLTADIARNHYYTTLIGFVPEHTVLVRTPLVQNLPIPMPAGT